MLTITFSESKRQEFCYVLCEEAHKVEEWNKFVEANVSDRIALTGKNR